jgi:class 3 adenylate cyclase
MKVMLLKVSATLLLVALLYTSAWGQSRRKVNVIDRKGEVVENPTVTVENDETHQPYYPLTDDKSVFILPPGNYTITASAWNLKAVEKVTIKEDEESPIKIKLIDQELIYIPYLINMICGALILLSLDIWLRRKNTPDPTLVWLYWSLIIWFVVLVMPFFDLKVLEALVPVPPKYYKYLLSVASSIFFVLTAFKLPRVRDWFSERKNLRLCRLFILIAILIISGISIYLLDHRNYYWGKLWDAAASTIAGIPLGAGLTYSYYKYGNRIFASITALNFLIFIVRQWSLAVSDTPTSGVFMLLYIANTTLVIMLFIALAVARGLSDASRLKTVGITKNVQIAAMFFDLRGSTQWAIEDVERDFQYVKFFMDDFREWAWKKASSSKQGSPRFVKFLGDGLMYVWEFPSGELRGNANNVAKLADDLFKAYLSWVNEPEVIDMYFLGTPTALGIGADVGNAVRLTFESGFDDYLGSPLNNAAKLQNLARPSGGVVIQEKMWNKLLDDIKNKFPKRGKLKLGDSDIPVRATENVELTVNQP